MIMHTYQIQYLDDAYIPKHCHKTVLSINISIETRGYSIQELENEIINKASRFSIFIVGNNILRNIDRFLIILNEHVDAAKCFRITKRDDFDNPVEWNPRIAKEIRHNAIERLLKRVSVIKNGKEMVSDIKNNEDSYYYSIYGTEMFRRCNRDKIVLLKLKYGNKLKYFGTLDVRKKILDQCPEIFD